MPTNKPYLVWFKDLNSEDTSLLDDKITSLTEIFHLGLPTPNGFFITTKAYFDFLEINNLDKTISELISKTNVSNSYDLAKTSKNIQTLIKKYPIPHEIAKEIMIAYKKLGGWLGFTNTLVTIKSSLKPEPFLSISGESNLLHKIQDCWASIFTTKFIHDCQKKNSNYLQTKIIVLVQKQINAFISGTIFTTNPTNSNKNEMIIEAFWGQRGSGIEEKIIPDEYLISKHNQVILSQHTGTQTVQLVQLDNQVREEKVKTNQSNKPKLTPEEIIKLATFGQKLALHFGQAQNVEFALNKQHQIFIIQSDSPQAILQKKVEAKPINTQVILTGHGINQGQVTGQVFVLNSTTDIRKIQKSCILVANTLSSDYISAIRQASAILTDLGGQSSYIATISRELGIPCIVGTQKATKLLSNGQIITVDGSTGKIYEPPSIHHNLQKTKSNQNYQTATKIYLNLGEPDLSKELAKQDIDGIGLLRAEFMMTKNSIHPKYLIAQNKQEEFIKLLTNNLLKFARNFSPRPIIYRASDFKSNEYRSLKYGKLYEPEEANPLFGIHGVSRYLACPDIFNLEVEAIKRVRNKFGYKNLHLSIPFVRTPTEMTKIKMLVNQAGLLRSSNFKLYMVAGLPGNMLTLDEFIKIGIDGVLIDADSLTMFLLGINPDNPEIFKNYQEPDPSLLWCFKKTIETCHKNNITCGVFGQTLANHQELIEKLVTWSIDSISVESNAITRTKELVHWAEHKRIVF